MKTPLLFEMNGRRALVVGLGRVGRRRARALADAGCTVTALIKAPPPADWNSTGVKVVQKAFEAADLASIDLAVAATDDPAEKRRRLKELTVLPTSKLAELAASQNQSEQSEEA